MVRQHGRGDVDRALAALPGARGDNWDKGMAEKEAEEG